MSARPCEFTGGPDEAACERPAVWILSGVLGCPSVCEVCYRRVPPHYRAGARRVAAEVPTVEAFTLVDRQFCERVAAEFYAAQAEDSGAAWASLAARMQRVMEGQYTTFTKSDAVLVESLHMAALRNGLAEGAKERSRMCSRLGVLLVLARRGRLAQTKAKA